MVNVRRALHPLVLALVALCATLFAGSAFAQEGPGAEEIQRRIQWLRDLPQDQKAKLKAALDRFRALPSADREKLRAKAAKLGPERLDGLSGRDIKALQKSRTTLDAEVDQVMTLLGPERIAAMSPEERAYVRSEAMRGFQRHVQRRLLGMQTYDEWEALSAEARRVRIQEALKRMLIDRMSRLPDDERARILSLSPKDQAAERAQMIAAYRMDQAPEFSRIFERFRLQKFLDRSPADRAADVRKWREKSRWHELARVLKEELGIAEDVRRDLAALGPAEWAKVMYEFQQTESLPLADRKLRLELMIHRLAGERALDRSQRGPRVAPFVRALRERRLLNGAAPRPPAQDSEVPR